jgi:curli production assembly/transport component CsgF
LLSKSTAFALLLLCCAAPASAEILYKPINPSFGGDPFNSSHLQGLAATENLFKPDSKSTTQSKSEQFLSMLESRLYSSLASQVADAIFGDNAQPHGTITFEDQTIVFDNTGTQITLQITDLTTGKVTNISIPTLQN